jgi:circadian clock protein KaiC
MMSLETPHLFGVSTISDDGISHLSDNVILLQFVRNQARLQRAIVVVKTRASRHEPEVREFKIAPEGIVLGDPLTTAP